MVGYIENGDYFVERELGTSTVFKEVSKEEYDRIFGMPYADAKREVKAGLSDSILLGYGFYGFSLRQQNDKYYIGACIGN